MITVMVLQAYPNRAENGAVEPALRFVEVAFDGTDVSVLEPAAQPMHPDVGLQIGLRDGRGFQLHKNHDFDTVLDSVEYEKRAARVRFTAAEFTREEMLDA